MTEAIVELAGVRRSFGAVPALTGLSLRAARGSVTVLLGPNGAGKTTAVRVMTGALGIDAGRVRVFGVDPATDGEQVRARTGVVAAKPALYDRLSGRDNLRYAAELYRLADPPMEAAAGRFGIAEALDLPVAGYSTGMRTRLALARATLHDPDLLLLDEPTAGLDPESARAVLSLIDEMAAGGRTVVMCTHLLHEAEGIADRVVILDRGADAVTGTPDELARTHWSPVVVLDAEDPAGLDLAAGQAGVVSYERRNGAAVVALDDLARVPDIVRALAAAGVRLTRVEPRRPTLEELYFTIRARGSGSSLAGASRSPEGSR